ncbi:hypothetical protein [Cupriavidus sp.]|uniref:hypothetical protein n=1 Tax=Cupriavidus sp. TaxID=1873897 RepID=UPI003D09BF33
MLIDKRRWCFWQANCGVLTSDRNEAGMQAHLSVLSDAVTVRVSTVEKKPRRNRTALRSRNGILHRQRRQGWRRCLR